MRTPHKGTLRGELSRYFEREMGGAGEKREQGTNCLGKRALELFQKNLYSRSSSAATIWFTQGGQALRKP
jgi:hypothetical protein